MCGLKHLLEVSPEGRTIERVFSERVEGQAGIKPVHRFVLEVVL